MENRFPHHNHHKSTFHLPMLCRLSIKDILILHPRRRCKSSSAASTDCDPSSPKVSCIGQVKRSSRVIAFPSAATTTTTNNNYSKLKKLFSSESLLPPRRTTAPPCSRRSKPVKKESAAPATVDVEELDPPLPVVKRGTAAARVEMNIWHRRINNGAERLQIELPLRNRVRDDDSHCSELPLQPTTV